MALLCEKKTKFRKGDRLLQAVSGTVTYVELGTRAEDLDSDLMVHPTAFVNEHLFPIVALDLDQLLL